MHIKPMTRKFVIGLKALLGGLYFLPRRCGIIDRMYTHILFDADNTLLDFSKAERSAFTQTMQAHSVQWDEALLSRYVDINISLWQEFERGRIDKETVQLRRFDMLLEGTGISAAELNRTFQTHLSAEAHLMPHAKEVCEALSAHAELSIVTNGVGPTQRKKVASTTIWPYFRHLFISEELGFPNPTCGFSTMCWASWETRSEAPCSSSGIR